MRLQACLEAYLDDCRVGLSPITAALYRRNIQPLVDWLAAQRVARLDRLTTTRVTTQGVAVAVPTTGDQCWAAQLPCTPYFNPDLVFDFDAAGRPRAITAP